MLKGTNMAQRNPVIFSLRDMITAGGNCRQNRTNSTLNREEVDKFAAMSSDWWNPRGVCAPLHSMNRLRVPLIREGLLNSFPDLETPLTSDKPLTGLSILDVGCGAGLLSEQLARVGAKVTGLDACQENIEAAKEHAELDPSLSGRLEYVCSTVEEHRENMGEEFQYDGVVASEVIEHVDRPDMFVSSCAELLKPGGCFFVTTINRTTRSWLVAIIGAEYVARVLPLGTHSWDKFLTPEEVTSMVERVGLVTRRSCGMRYLPVANTWHWTRDHSVNFALQAVKPDME